MISLRQGFGEWTKKSHLAKEAALLRLTKTKRFMIIMNSVMKLPFTRVRKAAFSNL